MDAESYGAAVDAHRWANGTAECFEMFGRDSSDSEGAEFYDIGTDHEAEKFANECYRCNGLGVGAACGASNCASKLDSIDEDTATGSASSSSTPFRCSKVSRF